MQTGAGKTYTMEGVPSDPGINYRTMKELFRCVAAGMPLCQAAAAVNQTDVESDSQLSTR